MIKKHYQTYGSHILPKSIVHKMADSNRHLYFSCLFLFLFLSIGSFAQNNQKNLVAAYEGGHHAPKTLLLYSDSSFRYSSSSDIMLITKKSKGIFSRTDSSITLYTRKKLAFLKSGMRKYWPSTWRIRNNKILFYSVKDEQSKDAGFYKAYNTFSLVEKQGNQ
jgi:hypothetical protein